MLVMDQKVTTQPILAELDERGIKFLTYGCDQRP